MAQQAILDVLRTERLVQEWIIKQVNHPKAEIVTGPPIDFRFTQIVSAKRRGLNCGPSGTVRTEVEDIGWYIDGAHELLLEIA
jgi:hypothetical protein